MRTRACLVILLALVMAACGEVYDQPTAGMPIGAQVLRVFVKEATNGRCVEISGGKYTIFRVVDDIYCEARRTE